MKSKALFAVAAAMFATSAALAAVSNLESYHLRHDFSTGERVALLGPQCTVDFIATGNETAVAGPNGAASAVHPTAANWGVVAVNGSAVANTYLAKNDWTLALCLCPGNTEKGVLFAVGRQNTTNGRSAISLCSSSDPTQLYLYDTRKSGSAAVETGHETITGLSNMTNGFHTVVMSYAKASSNLTVYVDGVKKVTRQIGGGNKSYYLGEGLQYCQTMSWELSGLGRTWGSNSDASFYDMRFYFGTFNDSDARAYAALYPADRMGSPFRPSAYVESGATNTIADARDIVTPMNYIDTGYAAKKDTEFVLDFQYLDWATVQQYIFGVYNGAAGSTPTEDGTTHCFYINGNKGFAFARFSETSADWHAITANNAADRIRRIVTIDNTDDASDTGSTATILTWEDRSTMASASTTKKHANDAKRSAYLFAVNTKDEAKRFTKARIYSFEADESGAPVLFLAPDMENGEAGLRDIITGTFHGDGNKDNTPERTLRFYDGVGRASDYKYEDSTLYAKLYVTSAENGAVSVADGAAAASAEGWVPRGGTLALAATVSDPDKYEFDSWTGDTWAIADGYSVSNASIEVSTPYAVQLRATFKPAANALLTIAADGEDAVNWSVADWRNIDNPEEAISAPVDKEVTVVAHKSVTLSLDADVSLSKFIVQADDNCIVTFASNDSSTFYASEVVASNGVLKLGTDRVLGATPLVTVKDGATFDFNGKVVGDGEAVPGNVVTEFHIAGAGAGDWPWALTSSENMTSSKNVGMLYLDANATIGGANELWMGVRNGAGWNSANKNLNLNGFTLTKTGAGTLQVRRPYSGNEGTIDVQSGTLRVSGWTSADAAYCQSCVSNVALVVREGATAANAISYALYFKTLDLCGGALTSSSGAFGMSAGETLAGHGMAAKLTMADGAVATLDGNLSVTTTLATDGALSFVRKTGVETNVTAFVSGAFATTTGNAITVGEGVILDIGINRPAATLAVDAAGTLALRLESYEDKPVVNVSANPAQLIVYRPDGAMDIASGCTVEYNAEAGTITVIPPVPVWTNTDGTGSFESVANWDMGEVPADGSAICVSNETDVTIAVSSAHAYDYISVKGGAALSFAGNGSLTANAAAFFDGTELKTGGVVVPAVFNGTGDLVVECGNGAEYAVIGASTLAGKLTIKATESFTNTFNAAVNVTSMTVEAGTNVVVTLVKGSGGSFLADEVVVAGGVLQQGSASVLGSTPKLTVLDGGTFDINRLKIENATKPYIAGAGAGDWPWAICSSSGVMADGNYLANITLNADATIGGPGQLKIGASDSAGNELVLNGHKLTLSGFWATFRNLNTAAGTLELASSYSITLNKWHNLNSNSGDYSGTTLIVRDGAKVINQTDRTIKATNIHLDGGSITASNTQNFGPISVLSGHGTIARLDMPEGAVFKPDGIDFLQVTTSISGTLKIDIRGIERTCSLLPLLSVPATLETAADEALDLSLVSRSWQLKKNNETDANDTDIVTYSIAKRALIIIFR